MFLGQYRHNIDDKGRLTIPARYRELLQDGAYVLQGFDRNLMLMTAPTFEQVYRRVNQMSMTDPTARQLMRLIFAAADRVDVDKTGRILLPQFLREVSGIQGEAVVVGVGNFIEIWTPEDWAEQVAMLQDAEANAQRFAAFDLSTGHE